MAHRTADAQREIDKHGAGKDGYQEGVDPPTTGTVVNEEALDMYQEEVCSAVEADNVTLATEASPDNTQLGDIIRERGRGVYGDGNEGDLVEATGFTMTSDRRFDNLTVQSGAVIKTNGYKLFVKGTLTVDAGGVIHNDGGDASGSTGGTGASAGTLAGGGDGGDGGAPANGAGSAGTGGTGNPGWYGGAGGAGGQGAGGGGAGGVGGGSGSQATDGQPSHVPPALEGYAFRPGTGAQIFNPGAGGGGGGADTVASGAGGGGGAGYMVIAAQLCVNNGTIRANGGDGADGSSGGGGGGGGGGVIVLCTRNLTGSGSIFVSPGAAGSSTTGSPGVVGSAGRYVRLAH